MFDGNVLFAARALARVTSIVSLPRTISSYSSSDSRMRLSFGYGDPRRDQHSSEACVTEGGFSRRSLRPIRTGGFETPLVTRSLGLDRTTASELIGMVARKFTM